MTTLIKNVDELTIGDLKALPIWEFINVDEVGEMAVRPIRRIPVKSLDGRLVGTQVRLANGTTVGADIGNIDAKNPKSTKHFLTLSVHRNGRRFTMARYHDSDRNRRGPDALAEFLGLRAEEVFPISYDIRRLCLGESAALAGTIEREPLERLTPEELIALAVR